MGKVDVLGIGGLMATLLGLSLIAILFLKCDGGPAIACLDYSSTFFIVLLFGPALTVVGPFAYLGALVLDERQSEQTDV